MDIGLIGLAVMGGNLALNIASKGFSAAVYNRTRERTRAFMSELNLKAEQLGVSELKIQAAYSLKELVSLLDRPRKIMLMVKAGAAVDSLIEDLLPLLDSGDIIIDGGNSHFPDSIRRCARVEGAGLLFVGAGVSGGEEGALHGPSLMPGGSAAAWEHIRPVFESISAKTADGEPCACWIGDNGAGHFVKMVHNGIEYGDMQLICEAYQLMADGLGLSNEAMSAVFDEWNGGELESYLIGITRDILKFTDEEGYYTVDMILDTAGQKGTGKWTAIAALDEGVPLPMTAEAVFARCLSAMKDERVRASEVYGDEPDNFRNSVENDIGATYRLREEREREKTLPFLEELRRAVYAAKIISYAQGFMLMRSAAKTYGWKLDYGRIASVWRGGCIIRSAFLTKISAAFEKNPQLENLLLDEFFAGEMKKNIGGLRRCVSGAAELGLPAPALMSALSWFDAYRCERLPANLLQAMRDYFGAHTYERFDRPRGEMHHTDWL